MAHIRHSTRSRSSATAADPASSAFLSGGNSACAAITTASGTVGTTATIHAACSTGITTCPSSIPTSTSVSTSSGHAYAAAAHHHGGKLSLIEALKKSSLRQ